MSTGANRPSRGGRGAGSGGAAVAAAGVSVPLIEAGPPPTVLVRIRALLPTLPPSERRVAEAAVADPAGVAAKTISELAADCDTSETTVIRFCRAVGLKGYPELRIGLAAAAGIEDAAAGAHTAGGDIGPGDSLADVVTKLGYADARAVEDTVAQVDLEVLERAVDAVVSAGAVDVYGIGASALIALDLHQKLHRIGHRAFAWPDAEAALTSAALLGRGDVAIGISHTGATPATVTALAEAHDNGARTIAITNFPALTDHRRRRPGPDHRGPRDHLPLRRHGQPHRRPDSGRLPVRRRRPAQLQPHDPRPGAHAERRAGRAGAVSCRARWAG